MSKNLDVVSELVKESKNLVKTREGLIKGAQLSPKSALNLLSKDSTVLAKITARSELIENIIYAQKNGRTVPHDMIVGAVKMIDDIRSYMKDLQNNKSLSNLLKKEESTYQLRKKNVEKTLKKRADNPVYVQKLDNSKVKRVAKEKIAAEKRLAKLKVHPGEEVITKFNWGQFMHATRRAVHNIGRNVYIRKSDGKAFIYISDRNIFIEATVKIVVRIPPGQKTSVLQFPNIPDRDKYIKVTQGEKKIVFHYNKIHRAAFKRYDIASNVVFEEKKIKTGILKLWTVYDVYWMGRQTSNPPEVVILENSVDVRYDNMNDYIDEFYDYDFSWIESHPPASGYYIDEGEWPDMTPKQRKDQIQIVKERGPWGDRNNGSHYPIQFGFDGKLYAGIIPVKYILSTDVNPPAEIKDQVDIQEIQNQGLTTKVDRNNSSVAKNAVQQKVSTSNKLKNKLEIQKKNTKKEAIEKRKLAAPKVVQYAMSFGDNLNVPFDQLNCVVNALMTTYGKYQLSLVPSKIAHIMHTECSCNKGSLCLKNEFICDCEGECKYLLLDVTMVHIVKFCRTYQIPYHIFDLWGMKITSETFTGTNNYKSFMASICDNHLYLIDDVEKRKSLCQSMSGKNASYSLERRDDKIKKQSKVMKYFYVERTTDIEKLSKEEMESITKVWSGSEHTDTYVMVNIENLFQLLLYIYTKMNLCPLTKYKGNKVISIMSPRKGNGNMILANPNKKLNINHQQAVAICELMEIPFRNSAMGAMSMEIFNKRYQAKNARAFLNDNQKQQVLVIQAFKCNTCQCLLEKGKFDFDHIISLQNNLYAETANDLENFQALCKPCHQAKTSKERTDKYFQYTEGGSYYNSVTKEIFTSLNKALIGGRGWTDQQDVDCIDVPKCRRNMFTHEAIEWGKLGYEFPVYTSLDQPSVFDPEVDKIISGFYYINCDDAINSLGYEADEVLHGSAWYSAPVVHFLFENKKQWWIKRITHKLIPSSTLPSNYYVDFHDFVLSKQKPGDGLDNVFKAIFNMFIGCLGINDSEYGKLILCKNKDELVYQAFEYGATVFDTMVDANGISSETKQVTNYDPNSLPIREEVPKGYKFSSPTVNLNDLSTDQIGNFNRVFSVISKRQTIKNNSMVPIYNMIMDMERIFVARLTMKLKETCLRLVPVYTNTDCVYYTFEDIKRNIIIEKKVRIPQPKKVPSQNAFVVHGWCNDSDDEEEEVYEITKTEIPNPVWIERSQLITDVIISQKFTREKNGEILTYPKYKPIEKATNVRALKLQSLTDVNFVLRDEWSPKANPWEITNDPMTKIYDDDFINKVVQMGSCLINGGPGTGKTLLLSKVRERLESLGKKVLILAPTHVAVIQAGGHSTLHSFFIKNSECGKTSYDYIIVDEISQVKEYFYRQLTTLQNNNPHLNIIAVGDFEQLSPVKEIAGWEYENSIALRTLCHSQKVLLELCRRSNNYMYELCKKKNIPNVKKEMFGSKKCKLSLTYLNTDRIRENLRVMKDSISKKQLKHVISRKVAENVNPNGQDIFIYTNVPLIGTVNMKSLGIINGMQYLVKRWDTKNVVIIEKPGIKKGRVNETELVLPVNDVSVYFHPGYCISLYKSQGMTISTEYTILGWDSMDDTMKLVALSRTENEKLINIVK
jgi:hypothetical protein